MNNNDDKILQILDQSACLRKSQLIGYLNRSLYPEELRTVELHLSSCALCNDALEGLEMISNAETLLDSIELPTLPAMVLPEKPVEKKQKPPEIVVEATPRPTLKKRHSKAEQVTAAFQQQEKERPRKKTNWLKPLGIAAGLAIIFACIWYLELGSDNSKRSLTAEVQQDKPNVIADNNASDDSANRLAMAKEDSIRKASIQNAKDSVLAANRNAERLMREKDSLKLIAVARISDTENTGKALSTEEAIAAKESASPQNTMSAMVPPESATGKKQANADEKNEELKDLQTEKSDFELGMQQYKKNNFASALLYFKTAESDDKNPKHWEAVYYCGMCSKSLDKKRRAIKYFERIVEANAPQAKAAQKQLDDIKGE